MSSQQNQVVAASSPFSSCTGWVSNIFEVQLEVIKNFVRENPIIAIVSMFVLTLLGFSPLFPSVVVAIIFSLACFGVVGLMGYFLVSQGDKILQDQLKKFSGTSAASVANAQQQAVVGLKSHEGVSNAVAPQSFENKQHASSSSSSSSSHSHSRPQSSNDAQARDSG